MNRFFVTGLAIALAACASAPPAPDGSGQTTVERYGAEAGEMTVGVIPDASITDASRNKDVLLSIDYPTRAKAAPVIVFSHALGASEREYAAYASHWASNGYVVIRVGHADAVRGLQADQKPAVMPGTAAEWVSRAHDRARDLKLVIDSLATLEQKYPELAGKMDAARIGVAGHAFGAMTAMLVGGLKTFPAGATTTDPRVRAVIAMSPPGPGERRGLTAESFAGLKVPTLFLTGTKDVGADDTETPAWREAGFDAAAAGDKWLITLNGAGRNTFSGLLIDEPVRERVDMSDPNWQQDPNRDPRIVQSNRRMPGEMAGASRVILAHSRSITLAFWDAYLRGDAAGRTFLDESAKNFGTVRTK